MNKLDKIVLKLSLLSLLFGLFLVFLIGRYDFSKIKNPFRNITVIKNEEELSQVVGKYILDKEEADCEDDDAYFYMHYKTSPGSSTNFKLVCRYFLPIIRVHEETMLIQGRWRTFYCDQKGQCIYGEKK